MHTQSANNPVKEEQSRLWHWAALAAIAIAAIVMFSKLDAAGLNGDEGFTAQMVKLPWATMLGDLGTIDYNMSLHYIVLKAWTSLFGFGEVALRIPSMIAVVAGLLVLFQLVSGIANRRLATLAVIFAALNPFVLTIGLTARSYGFLFLWTVFATQRLVAALKEQTPTSWVWYGVVAVVGLHIHLMAAMVIAAHGIVALIEQRGFRKNNLAAAGVIILFGFVPSLIFLAPADTLAWIGPFRLPQAVTTGIVVGGGGIFGIVMIVLVLIGMLRPSPGSRRPSLLAAVWLGVPVVLSLALAPFQSLFIDLYFVVIAAPLAILAALGMDLLLGKRAAWLVPAGVAVGGFGLALGLTAGRVGNDQGWPELSLLVSEQVEAADLIAFPNAYYRIVAEYYSPAPEGGPYPPGSPTLPGAAWGTLRPLQLDTLKRTGGQAEHEVFEPQLLQHPRIWLVGLQDEFFRAVAADLEQHGYRLASEIETHRVKAFLYASN